jgi:hypothetical protein
MHAAFGGGAAFGAAEAFSFELTVPGAACRRPA